MKIVDTRRRTVEEEQQEKRNLMIENDFWMYRIINKNIFLGREIHVGI
jgi:hypothetical protein